LGTSGTTFGPQEYLERVTANVASKHMANAACPACWDPILATAADHTGCHVDSVHSSWEWNAFMFGPIFTSLVREVVSIDTVTQQVVLDAAGSTVNSASIDDYYSGSWVAISTMTLNGDLHKAAVLIQGLKQPLTCTLPNTAPLGYDIDGMSCAGLTNAALACLGATCSAGYAGAVTYACSADGAAVTLSGCMQVLQCTLPLVAPVGYVLSGSSCVDTSSTSLSCVGVASCDAGSHYLGTMTYTACTVAGGEVIFGGCSLDECAAGTDNCDANAICTDTNSGFSCACKAGFTGSGTDGTCVESSSNCYNSACGCPPFTGGEQWCDESNALIATDWCQEAEGNCGNCGGTWCGSSSFSASLPTPPPTPSPVSFLAPSVRLSTNETEKSSAHMQRSLRASSMAIGSIVLATIAVQG